ncbi:hypothetical protein KEM52_006704 [Ascosphaera acerosa]|nr:hypothetical protein KEM52_006704 [Ascosphaera acerosa]
MAARGLANPAPKTESARAALSSFHCTLCNKSYARHPEYEAHIGSYDHQHKKRLRDLKQLSKDPTAAERARRAERRADEKAGLIVVESKAQAATGSSASASASSLTTGKVSVGFKKGGFKSSFASVAGPQQVQVQVQAQPEPAQPQPVAESSRASASSESARAQRAGDVADNWETDEDELESDCANEGGYYNPDKPTSDDSGAA